MTNNSLGLDQPAEPVELIDTGSEHREVKPGIALCLSGGGYRAMLFHVGSLWRLHEAGLLDRAKRISGGSLTSALLALKSRRLSFDPASDDFFREVAEPDRRPAVHTLDAGSVIERIFLPGSISNKIASDHRKRLFGEAMLQDLPDESRFVINDPYSEEAGTQRRGRSHCCA